MKKLVIIVVLIIVIVIGLVFYFHLTATFQINKQLSKRALEFIQSQKANQSDFWAGVNFTDKQNADAQVVVNNREKTDDCFTITIPFAINNQYSQGSCNQYYSIINPRGKIFIFTQPSTLSSLDDEGNVMMRRKFPEKYEEKWIKVNGRDYLTFKRKDDPTYAINVFALQDGKELTLSMQADSFDSYDEQVKQMLNSLQLL